MDGRNKLWGVAAAAVSTAVAVALIARSAASQEGSCDKSKPSDGDRRRDDDPVNEPGQTPARPRVVIVGGGFAGISAANVLGNTDVSVTLIDRNNHHLFQPLLYQVALATLAPSDISVPIRWLLRNKRNIDVLMANVDRIDADRSVVVVDGSAREIPFDYLIVATGASHSYFGHPDWEAHAPGLKTLDDALGIRNRFLTAFEEAEKATTAHEREIWQTFVVVGGGPTGVELSGLIPEIARHALRPDFHRVDTCKSRVILAEGGPRLLPSFPESLSAKARKDLEDLGVEVRLNCTVEQIDAGKVVMNGEEVEAKTILWAAGNAASPLLASLDAPRDRAGRLQVAADLSVPGAPNIFVVGDAAAFTSDGKMVPGVAPAANQEGALAAVNVLADIAGKPRTPFRYFDKGNLATIGRQRAIADFGFLRLSGNLAWWMWLFVHILYLAGFRNRISVLIQWAYAYLTYQRGVRLISRPPEMDIAAAETA